MFRLPSPRRARAALGVLVLLLGLGVSGPSAAQSSADVELSLTRGEAVQISNIDDWLIGVFTASDSIANIQYNWDAECVFTTSGAYRVEVLSQNDPAGALTLRSGSDTMAYELWTYSRTNTTGAYQLRGFNTSPVVLSGRRGSTSPTCAGEPAGGTNLWFAALVRPGPFNAAPPGIYQDVATIIVSPE